MEEKNRGLILEKQALIKEKYLDFAILCLEEMEANAENLVAANEIIKVCERIIKEL